MEEKRKQAARSASSVALAASPAPAPRPRPWVTAGAASAAPAARVGPPRSDEVRRLFASLERREFSVRQVAGCLDEESRRLARLYQRLILQGDLRGRGEALDATVVAPLIGHLGRGVDVGDVHQVLNVAREPLFDDGPPVRGSRKPKSFGLERAVALYVLWRLGLSFHLVPAIRRSIARQFSLDLVRSIAAGREVGIAVTPFVAAIGDLDELAASSFAEVVAFSLTGLVAHALHALDATL